MCPWPLLVSCLLRQELSNDVQSVDHDQPTADTPLKSFQKKEGNEFSLVCKLTKTSVEESEQIWQTEKFSLYLYSTNEPVTLKRVEREVWLPISVLINCN